MDATCMPYTALENLRHLLEGEGLVKFNEGMGRYMADIDIISRRD